MPDSAQQAQPSPPAADIPPTVAGALTLWLVPYQPTNGRMITPAEYILLLALLWFLVWLLVYDADADQWRTMGAKLSKSRLSGVMVTLTTLLVIFFLAEFGLRLFYITTDGYGFTAMNYQPVLLCSPMIRRPFRQRLGRVMPAHYHPAVYSMASGLALLLLVGLWQHSNVVLLSVEGPLRWGLRGLFLVAGVVFLWSVRALGLTTSLAPMTSTTSASANSGLMDSRSKSCS